MGKVYTTDEDLTNIANAIRAKSGTNSSLVYPTEFISTIQNIQTGSNDTWNGFGKNETLIKTILDESIIVKNTDYNNISTLTSSSQTIVDQRELETISIDYTNYEYHIICTSYINFTWNSKTINSVTYPLEYIYLYHIVYSPYIATDFFLRNIASSKTSAYSSLNIVIGQRNGYSVNVSTSTIGWNFSYTMTSQSGNNILCKSPKITLGLSNSYFTNDTKSELDIDNTIIENQIKLYRYDKNSSYVNQNYNIVQNLYQAHHPEE